MPLVWSVPRVHVVGMDSVKKAYMDNYVCMCVCVCFTMKSSWQMAEFACVESVV